MTMKQVIGHQGEVRIIKIDALPEGMETRPVERVEKGFIISHSEKGHHHVLTRGDIVERTDNVPEGMKIFYAILYKPASLIQDAGNAHGGYDLAPGIYQFRVSREYNPFLKQARLVVD